MKLEEVLDRNYSPIYQESRQEEACKNEISRKYFEASEPDEVILMKEIVDANYLTHEFD